MEKAVAKAEGSFLAANGGFGLLSAYKLTGNKKLFMIKKGFDDIRGPNMAYETGDMSWTVTQLDFPTLLA